MHLKKYFLVAFLAFSISMTIDAQDFHYTQYFFSPLGVNPALAGGYNGSYRINGIYRDQYRGAANKPFTGFSLNVDAPIIRGIRKQDWVGIGLRMEQATAGSIGQKLNFYGLGAAYHLGLDKKQTRILSIGLQYGTGGYSYDNVVGKKIFAEQIINDVTSETAQIFLDKAKDGSIVGGSLNDLTAGLVYMVRNPKTGGEFKVGLGVEGILNPNRSAINSIDKKGIGLNIFSSYDYMMNKRTSLTSGIYYYSNKKASAINLNSILNYKMKPGNKMTLHAGAGLRNVRAVLVYLGATVSGIRVGVGYDLDVGNSTSATGGHKSLEIGVSYVGMIFKKPKPKPIIYCPRL